MNTESTNDLVTKSVTSLNGSQQNYRKSFRSMTFKEKLSYIREVITVEPLIACYIIPSIICGTALFNLELEKACRANAGYNDTVCDSILAGNHANYTAENNHMQEIIVTVHSWQYPLQNFVPILLILFLGSYSDRYKIRKPFLLLPICGEFFAVAGCILCVIFMKELPIEVQGFAQTVVPSFLGGPTMLIMALFAYISDISTIEMRTLRIGIVQIVLNICTTLLTAVGGILFEKIGYIGVLVIGGIMYFIGLCYGYFYIKEKPNRPHYSNAASFFKDLFNPMHAVQTFALVLKKKAGVNLPLLILVLCFFFLSALIIIGENTVLGLYLQKVYSWTPVKYSYYETIRSLIALAGTTVGVPLFTKILKLHDAVIVIVSFLDKIAANLIYIFYDTVAGLYVAPIVGICSGLANIALRSLVTKCVLVQDLAKALSLLAFIETLASIAAAPIYNTGVYNETIETYPSAFFFVAVAMFGASVLIILPTYCTGIGNIYASAEEQEKQQDTADKQQTTRV